MKAIVFDQPGDAEVLHLGEAPAPVAGPRDITVEVHATSVNRADLYQRMGKYPPPRGASEILGLDGAGIVRAVGSHVRRFRVGDRVMALLAGGGYAEELVVDQGSAMRLPDGWSMVEGGAFPEVFLTAFLNLFRIGRLAAGESVFVHGGGSGVGTAAIALAREAGATIHVTAGTAEKAGRCRALGAAGAFDYHGDWQAEVMAATDGRGVDVILDPIGARYLESHLASLATGGRLLAIGGMGGVRRAEIDWPTLMAKRITIVGSTLRARPVEEKAAIVLEFEERFGGAIAAGRIRPVIDSIHPLAEAAAAHRRLESGDHFGKVALRVRDE